MPASNIGELLKECKDAEEKQYTEKGRRQRALWRDEHMTQYDPIGAVWHFKNAAAKWKYDRELAALVERDLPAADFQHEAEILIHKYGNAVPIYMGINAKVRHDLRSRLMKEQRRESELGSQEDELSSENYSPSDNT